MATLATRPSQVATPRSRRIAPHRCALALRVRALALQNSHSSTRLANPLNTHRSVDLQRGDSSMRPLCDARESARAARDRDRGRGSTSRRSTGQSAAPRMHRPTMRPLQEDRPLRGRVVPRRCPRVGRNAPANRACDANGRSTCRNHVPFLSSPDRPIPRAGKAPTSQHRRTTPMTTSVTMTYMPFAYRRTFQFTGRPGLRQNDRRRSAAYVGRNAPHLNDNAADQCHHIHGRAQPRGPTSFDPAIFEASLELPFASPAEGPVAFSGG